MFPIDSHSVVLFFGGVKQCPFIGVFRLLTCKVIVGLVFAIFVTVSYFLPLFLPVFVSTPFLPFMVLIEHFT